MEKSNTPGLWAQTICFRNAFEEHKRQYNPIELLM